MSESMVERVAKVILTVERDILTPDVDRNQVSVDPRVMARRILEAMREPSKLMLDAGMSAGSDALDSDWSSDADGNRHDYSYLRSDGPSIIWRAMLDAALTEEGASNE